MIKEKQEKGPDGSSAAVKDEPTNSDSALNKSLETAETRIKTEDDTATTSCSGGLNKDCGRALTKNGANNVIGSTNTGSLHNLVDQKEPHLLESTTDDVGAIQDDATLLGLKTEEGLETKLPQDVLNNMGMTPGVPGPGVASTNPPPPDGVQPLASNVINKQSSSMEVQYMQQQSQIFVFSTLLANRGADAVMQGQFPSIIAYHCAQPSTKKYLEKNPLKITQFNRHNPAQWLNNLAMMKNKGCTRGPGVMGKGPPNIDGFLSSDGLEDMVGLSEADLPWEQKPNPHITGGLDGISNGGPLLPNDVDSPCLMRSSPGATVSMSLGHSPIMTNANSASPSLASMQPSLQGVKVPDENLTPQQRQHREEQLATIRKMQQMLFPEHQSMGMTGEHPAVSESSQDVNNQGTIPGSCSGPGSLPVSGAGPSAPGPGSCPTTTVPGSGTGSIPTTGPGSGSCSGSGSGMDLPPTADMCDVNVPPGSVPGGSGMVGSMGPGPGMMNQRPMNVIPGGPGQSNSNMSPGMNAQMEWQKLRHQYSEERKIQGPGVPARNTTPVIPRSGSGPGPRLQGPPPPYHQTPRSASVPIALQSPSPASPNNPTSNLSLPSPRASSALNSPADPGRSFSLNRHLSTGQSPTSQDSPSTSRGLIPSNPGTPISSHLSPNSNLIVSTAQDFPPTSGPTPTTSHQSSDGMFGRTLQSLAQQKQQSMCTSTNSTTVPVSKEPNLMPVPSPQQIQYLNTFEGQELTIQKQPNTSLKDGNIISPSMISTSIDNSFSSVNNTSDMSSRLSGPNTPMTPSSIDIGPRFPSTPTVSSDGCRFQMSSPQTSTAPTDKGQRVVGGTCLSPQGSRTPGSAEMLKSDIAPQFPTSSPHGGGVLDVHRFSGSGSNVCPTTSPGPFPPQQQQQQPQQQPPQQQQPNKMPGFMNISPSNKGPGMDLSVSTNYGCVRSDNVPLNPNSTPGIPGNPKVSHFDPISSLAQMSQQLTNSVASSLNGQGGQGGAMMGFNSSAMHMMDPMGGCHGIPELDSGPSSCGMLGMPMQGSSHPHGYHPNSTSNSPLGPVRSLSPKMNNPGGPGPGPFPGSMSIPRMMGRGPGCNPYNGANVQVKPNAPNTIQYLPAKPQMGNQNPRGPPSLEFLHRFANPLTNLESKMPTQNLQYFPNCGPNTGPMGGGNVPTMGHIDGGHMGGDGPMGGMMNGPMGNGAMNNGPMMGGNMGMGGNMMGQPGMGMNMPMMRGPAGLRPMGMIRMQQMGFNGPGGGNGGGPANDPMFSNPNMPNPNAQMFVAGPKSSPMGLGAPDASQPLPPSMGQGNTFKNSQFIGPTTADPNYAQQFHNFQQQLYATTTRSQMSSQAMGPGPGPGPPHSANQPYFVPK